MSGNGMENLWLYDDRGDKAYSKGRLIGWELEEYKLINGILSEIELTPREFDIVIHAAAGLTDKETGRELGISFRTVQTQWVRLRAKLNSNRAGIVARCIFEDYVSIDDVENVHKNRIKRLKIKGNQRKLNAKAKNKSNSN